MALESGHRLGPYEIVAPLGAGGMGEVYRARDTNLNREVAIKVLPGELAGDPDRLARFEREAKLLAALNHSGIAHVYGFERAALPDGSALHFLAMELVEGEDLGERLKRGAIPVDEAIGIAKQIAEALEEAHEKGIVHRDLKPANVKVTPDGKVKVLDFGLAKAWAGEGGGVTSSANLSQSPTLAHTGTAAGLILGTAAYMSPEQARGKGVDKRADIWAFGALLYEMLTGRRLFDGETVSDVLAAVLTREPEWSRLPSSTPSGVHGVLRRCLARDPRERLHDIADARIELLEATDDQAPRPATASSADSFRSRWWRRAAGAALLVFGVSLGAALSWRTGRPQATPAIRFSVTPPGAGGMIRAVEVSRDGRRLVYSLSSERRLLLHDLNEFESRPLAGTEGASRPFLSPDGRWIGFYQAGKIRKLAFDGGDPIDVCEAPEDTPGAAWGPDNAVFFSPTWTGSGLWRADAAGGKPVELTKPDRAKGETGHFWPDILPDGKAALFTIFGGVGLADSKVGLLDLESRRYEVLFEGAAARYVASGHIVYYRGGAYRSVAFDPARRRVSGPEATVLRQVRRRSPVGSAESYAAFGAAGVLAYVEGDSTHDEPPSRLAWVSREGRVTELPFEGNHGAFRLSPDGTRVAAQRFASGQQQIHIYDLERGTSEPLTRDGQNFDPAWHPDGRHVAFTSQLRGNFDVRWAPADGSAPPAPLVATPVDEGTWQWSPDARSAIFVVWSPVSGTDFWHADGSGGNPKPLLASPLPEGDAAFSADGQWLAYVSGDSLYVSPYPSLGQRVLIAAGASSPRWSRSTSELFYVETGRMKAMAYEVRGGAFQAGAAKALFELGRLRPVFDVASDGKRFLFLAATGDQAGRDVIRVVLNGFDMLRAEATAETAR